MRRHLPAFPVVLLLLVQLTLQLSACALVRTGAFQQAQDRYNEGDYREAITKAGQVLSYGRASASEPGRAQLLKAQCYEKLGEVDQAIALYAYVAKTFPDAPEAYQATVALARLLPTAPARDEGSGF